MAVGKEQNDASSGLDEQLLARNEESSRKRSRERVEALRQAKNESSSGKGYFEDEPQTLRQAVMQEKRKKQQREEKLQEKKEASGTGRVNAIRKGSSSLLRASWINAIETFGATILWINVHVLFLHRIFGSKYFAKLGEEWGDKAAAAKNSGAGKVVNKVSRSIGVVEKIGLGVADLGCLVIVLIVFAIIALVVNYDNLLVDAISELPGFAWRAVKSFLGLGG